jgi:hypothetical protein
MALPPGIEERGIFVKLHVNGGSMELVAKYLHTGRTVLIRHSAESRYRFDVYTGTGGRFSDGDSGFTTVSEAREAAAVSAMFEGEGIEAQVLKNAATPATLDTIPARLPGF